jgi:hypothetical protein
MPKAMSEGAGLTILNGGMDPDKFPAVLSAFGRLPAKGQRPLAEGLVAAVAVYRVGITMKGQQPCKERDRLKRIADSSKRLLEQLGVDDQQALKKTDCSLAGGMLLVELYKVAQGKRPPSAGLAAQERWIDLLYHLAILKEAANRCAAAVVQRSPRKVQKRSRGGRSRHGIEPKGVLLESLFAIYATCVVVFQAVVQHFLVTGC